MPPRRRSLAWLLILALVLAAGWAVLRARDDGATYAEATVGRIEQAIETTGTFRAIETVAIRGAVSGTVATVAVRPGDRVAAGDIVATLDPAALERNVAQAAAALEEAELAAAVADAHAQTGGDAEIAEALLAASRADAAHDALVASESALESAVLVSTTTGTVLEVPIAAGAPYSAGSAAVLIAGDAIEITATLDQADLPLVEVGAVVRVIPDALPELELSGRIAEIAPRGEQEGGAVRFAIIVSLTEQPPSETGLRVGMTARLVVPAVSVDAALLVPVAAVETVGRRSFVHVRRDGDEVTVEITLGLRQGGLVQVAAGDLTAGERVRISS